MRNVRIPVMLLLGIAVLWGTARSTEGVADQGGEKIALVDDCDPNDPNWGAVPGCLQDKGDVSQAEFNMFLRSPLYDNDGDPASTAGQFLVGHPSWRNEPSHLVIAQGRKIQITNEGGRPHTFTKVAQFGGGRIPPLLVGTQMAPECALAAGTTDPNQVAPGGQLKLITSGEGILRFQCCFHPWMRATVRVTPAEN